MNDISICTLYYENVFIKVYSKKRRNEDEASETVL